jgi:iron complex transport system substrate-binding protein
MMSVEDILASDPDVILTITRGAPGVTALPDAIQADPLWSEMTAAQNGRVYELDNILFLQSPGMNFPDAFLQLWDILYGAPEGN